MSTIRQCLEIQGTVMHNQSTQNKTKQFVSPDKVNVFADTVSGIHLFKTKFHQRSILLSNVVGLLETNRCLPRCWIWKRKKHEKKRRYTVSFILLRNSMTTFYSCTKGFWTWCRQDKTEWKKIMFEKKTKKKKDIAWLFNLKLHVDVSFSMEKKSKVYENYFVYYWIIRFYFFVGCMLLFKSSF